MQFNGGFSKLCRLAQWVEQASHVQRLCPRCGGPGFDSWPGSLCCSGGSRGGQQGVCINNTMTDFLQ